MLPFAADTILIFIAASLTRPLQPTLDAYAARTNTVILRESGASLEHVRKITELHRTADLLLLADADVFPRFLVPKYSSWFAEFARDRMVVAYTDKSKHANEITAANWTRILSGNAVEVGRTDPNLAPVGYRTLLMFDLAEKHYNSPGLARTLLTHAPERNMRPNAAALAALLAAGELDYIYDYQSVAESNGFRFIALPPQIDLGDAARASSYATVSMKVRGSVPGQTITVTGQPILYALTVPKDAPHAAAARRFLDFLTTPATMAALRNAHIDVLEHPVVVGNGAPSEIHGAVRR